ncbi:MAG: carboxypeptidase-like regulatory domain-containing protein [Gemmatimonadota bacterium]
MARTTLVLAATLPLGCAPSILGTDPDTGISVLVLRGPISPVSGEGEENTAPVADALVRVREVDGSGTSRTRTGVDGRARLLLVPGRYRVDVVECPGALALPGPDTVTVAADRIEPLTLECDTGIR